MAQELIVYTDDKGTTYQETCNTASFRIVREEELEAAGYVIVHG